MTSDPSNPKPGEVFPQSLRIRLGISNRQRCLSSRDGREVWLVEDVVGARRVFKIHRDRDTESLARFQQVREVLNGLPAGTGLLAVIDYGLEPVHGLAWEELPVADALDPDGAGFDEYSPATLASEGFASASSAAKAALEVVKGLEFLHRRGWVHGDVKPANVLKWNGEWVLGDYDTLGHGSEAGRTITASTEGYCPPGTCEGPDRDFFALGKLIYELWSGNSRLEYPSIPSRLTDAGTWSREDRLINRLIEALCHPMGLNRLRRLEQVQEALEAVASGTAALMTRAESLLQPRGHRSLKIAVAVASIVILGGVLLMNSGWLPALPLGASLVALTAQGVPEREPTKGLVAYYPLDGDAQDHSGRGHHGTAFQVSWSADASKAPGRAGHFNGEAGISIPEFPESETNAFSISLWFRAERPHHGKLFLKDRAVGDKDSPGRQWAVAWDERFIKGGVWIQPEGSSNPYRTFENPPKVPKRRWIHVVEIWNGRSLDLWVDGLRMDSISAEGRMVPGDSPLRIGWDQYYFFKGDIDEVRLYDRPLSEDEVRGMYHLGLRRAFRAWGSSLLGR